MLYQKKKRKLKKEAREILPHQVRSTTTTLRYVALRCGGVASRYRRLACARCVSFRASFDARSFTGRSARLDSISPVRAFESPRPRGAAIRARRDPRARAASLPLASAGTKEQLRYSPGRERRRVIERRLVAPRIFLAPGRRHRASAPSPHVIRGPPPPPALSTDQGVFPPLARFCRLARRGSALSRVPPGDLQPMEIRRPSTVRATFDGASVLNETRENQRRKSRGRPLVPSAGGAPATVLTIDSLAARPGPISPRNRDVDGGR